MALLSDALSLSVLIHLLSFTVKFGLLQVMGLRAAEVGSPSCSDAHVHSHSYTMISRPHGSTNSLRTKPSDVWWLWVGNVKRAHAIAGHGFWEGTDFSVLTNDLLFPQIMSLHCERRAHCTAHLCKTISFGFMHLFNTNKPLCFIRFQRPCLKVNLALFPIWWFYLRSHRMVWLCSAL